MRRIVVPCFAFVLIAVAAPFAQAPPAWDATFRSMPVPANIKDNMQRLSAHPHHVGSPYDKDNAEWILARFKEWGWDAQIESFTVLFPTPKERVLELVAPTKFTAKLEEPTLAIDPTSGQKSEQLPTYNAYSIDGDVTAPLVYVNYGRPDDYEVLDRLGISVKGAIVIARYGESWRGIKPKVAAEHGAIGCLIYSDPKDDGYAGDATFSDGPMRPKDGVQRGSVADMPLYPGDPLTPGVGATADAKRLPLSNVPTLTKIPVMPISYADAQPLLQSITGPVAPSDWRGGLPITYRIGPGGGRAHLKLAFNWDSKPVYDVIAKIPGSTFPDEWIVRGNHHDGWVNGAEDPISGMSAELEEARALGELRKRGWQPKRTIVYAAWDGEEPGLLGSTEWVETHMADLQAHAVAYLNTDSSARGFFSMEGSHTLERFINDVARDIIDPETGKSVWARAQAKAVADGSNADARTRHDLHIGALGSGSDFSSFLQHAGVASLDLSYGGEDSDGIYHSIYDDFYFFTHFLDTDFAYGRALAQTLGTAVIRLADADLLPFRFTNLSETVSTYTTELKALLKKQQDDVRERNQRIADGVFALINDPKRPQQPPKTEAVARALNFAPLDNAVTALTDAATRYDDRAASAKLAGNTKALASINQKLLKAEQQFLDPTGLPGRDWYQHLLYAPGFYTGYGVKTMPGVRESIEQKQYTQADAEIVRVAAAIMREVKWLDAMTKEIGG